MRIPPLPPAEPGTRFSDPGGMQGWVDLCYVKANRSGIEPATCKSQVQRPTNEPPPRSTYYVRNVTSSTKPEVQSTQHIALSSEKDRTMTTVNMYRKFNIVWKFCFYALATREGNLFCGCPPRSSIRSSGQICNHDISWTAWAISMKRTGNIHQPLLMRLGSQKSKVRVTAGRRGGDDIHVDTGYASGQTYRHTDTQIAMFRSPAAGQWHEQPITRASVTWWEANGGIK